MQAADMSICICIYPAAAAMNRCIVNIFSSTSNCLPCETTIFHCCCVFVLLLELLSSINNNQNDCIYPLCGVLAALKQSF